MKTYILIVMDIKLEKSNIIKVVSKNVDLIYISSVYLIKLRMLKKRIL